MCKLHLVAVALVLAALAGCSSDDEEQATVQIKNDFDNPEMAYQPPWIICESSYRGVEFGKLEAGATSEAKKVSPGLDYVLMVAAWDDPSCASEHCLPIASRNEEEVVSGQTRSIAINMPNHQGPCPPEGIAPIPKQLYDRILSLWPDYAFVGYAERTTNLQCLPSDGGAVGAAGAAGAGGSAGSAGTTDAGGAGGAG